MGAVNKPHPHQQHHELHVTLHLSGANLPKKDLMGLGKSDPYFEVYYGKDKFYKSEVKSGTRNPEWAPAEFSLPKTAINKNVTIKVMDRDRITRDDKIHSFEIKYPFEQKTYVFGKGKDTSSAMQFSVLNNDPQE